MIKKIPLLDDILIARFKSKYIKYTIRSKNPKRMACWPWIGSRAMPQNYGKFFIKTSYYYAHRISYELHYGIDPIGKMICHSCDNTLCVNPYHLFMGTQKDNVRDIMSKGRHRYILPRVRGEDHGMTRLTANQIKKIKSLYFKFGYNQYDVAKKFSVSQATISNIINGKTWGHI